MKISAETRLGMKQLKIVKNMYIVMDVCLIIVGMLILFSPIRAINVLCKIFGFVLVMLGAVKIVGYFTKDIFQLAFQFDFALGIISAILGAVLIFRTSYMVEILSVCVGIFILIDGALKLQTAVDAKKFGIENWWLILVIALLVSIVGIILMVIPFAAQTMAAWIIGINLVLDGVLNICVVLSTVKTIRRKRLES